MVLSMLFCYTIYTIYCMYVISHVRVSLFLSTGVMLKKNSTLKEHLYDDLPCSPHDFRYAPRPHHIPPPHTYPHHPINTTLTSVCKGHIQAICAEAATPTSCSCIEVTSSVLYAGPCIQKVLSRVPMHPLWIRCNNYSMVQMPKHILSSSVHCEQRCEFILKPGLMKD